VLKTDRIIYCELLSSFESANFHRCQVTKMFLFDTTGRPSETPFCPIVDHKYFCQLQLAERRFICRQWHWNSPSMNIESDILSLMRYATGIHSVPTAWRWTLTLKSHIRDVHVIYGSILYRGYMW